VHVAASTSAALGCNENRAYAIQIREWLPRVGIEQLCPYRYAHHERAAARAVLVFATAVLPGLGAQHAPIPEVEQGAQLFICFKDYIAAVSAVASGRAA
jgi:hypothetical protein